MTEIRLQTQGLCVGYHGQPLLREVQLTLRPGEIMTLIGRNGAGKSTLLKSIIGQLALIGGTVFLNGADMAGLSAQKTARQLSILMTTPVRPERMTCFDVVAAGRYPYTGQLGILTGADRQKTVQCLELVHAAQLADRDFSQISDGQRQRVLLARALCQEPDVLVLDEPTSFLDLRHKLELLAILKDLVRTRQLAVLLSLHELDLAQKISDWVICVHGAYIERQGPPEEIFTLDTIAALYGTIRGSYHTLFGSLELEPVRGTPEVFVIGGGGAGIPVYRRLQRQGFPFAAGVLAEHDLDYPVADALAATVISERAFQTVGGATFRRALSVIEQCKKVLCPVTCFGPVNEKNRQLREAARAAGKLE